MCCFCSCKSVQVFELCAVIATGSSFEAASCSTLFLIARMGAAGRRLRPRQPCRLSSSVSSCLRICSRLPSRKGKGKGHLRCCLRLQAILECRHHCPRPSFQGRVWAWRQGRVWAWRQGQVWACQGRVWACQGRMGLPGPSMGMPGPTMGMPGPSTG